MEENPKACLQVWVYHVTILVGSFQVEFLHSFQNRAKKEESDSVSRKLDHLEPELQVVVWCLVWLLGTELGSFEREPWSLNC